MRRTRKIQIRKLVVFVANAITLIMLTLIPGLPLMGTAFSGQHTALLPSRFPVSFLRQSQFLSQTKLSNGKFLVASEQITDPNFSKTVVLLIHYDWNGAMGLVINRPTEVKISSMFPEIGRLKDRTDTVFIGGPVARNQMLMLLRSNSTVEEADHIFDNIYVSSSRAALEQIIGSADPEGRFRIYAGHAGWAPGQLDQEVSIGGWHVMPADAEMIFHKAPSEIWPELIRRSSLQWVKVRKPGRKVEQGFEPGFSCTIDLAHGLRY